MAVREIELLNKKFDELEKRKGTVLQTIEEQGKLTEELKSRIEKTFEPSELEDIYLPFKPKRRTRATTARELGLEPLAERIMKMEPGDVDKWAAGFVKEGVENTEAALQGARDIIAEWISENSDARNSIRRLFDSEASIYSSVVKDKEKEGEKYSDYFDYSGPLKKCPSHRMLAIRRGEGRGHPETLHISRK